MPQPTERRWSGARIYPTFAKTAEKEGFLDIGRLFFRWWEKLRHTMKHGIKNSIKYGERDCLQSGTSDEMALPELWVCP